MEHKTAFLYLQAGIILQRGGKKLPFSSAEIHKPSPNFHSPWNSPVKTIRMKMRITPGEMASNPPQQRCEEPSTEIEEESCLSVTKTCRTSVVTLWDLGASGLTSRGPQTIPGLGRCEGERIQGLGKFKAVMPVGYVLLSGLQGGTSLLY